MYINTDTDINSFKKNETLKSNISYNINNSLKLIHYNTNSIYGYKISKTNNYSKEKYKSKKCFYSKKHFFNSEKKKYFLLNPNIITEK